MVLSDKDIKEAIKSGVIGIDPYFEKDKDGNEIIKFTIFFWNNVSLFKETP